MTMSKKASLFMHCIVIRACRIPNLVDIWGTNNIRPQSILLTSILLIDVCNISQLLWFSWHGPKIPKWKHDVHTIGLWSVHLYTIIMIHNTCVKLYFITLWHCIRIPRASLRSVQFVPCMPFIQSMHATFQSMHATFARKVCRVLFYSPNK